MNLDVNLISHFIYSIRSDSDYVTFLDFLIENKPQLLKMENALLFLKKLYVFCLHLNYHDILTKINIVNNYTVI